MKKILFTINYLTNGGPTRVLENIIKNLDRKDYEVSILTIIDKNDEKIVGKFVNNRINIISFSYSKSLKEVISHKKEIFNKVDNFKPDIIHTHGIVTTLLFAKYDKNVKKITTIHNNMFEDYKFTYGKLKGLVYSCVHLFLLKKFDNVICCSKTSYDSIKKYLKNISYVRNGIDIEFKSNTTRDKIREELNIPTSAIVYVYGGVINNRKRVCELVELFNNNLLDNEYLLIVGDGDLLNRAKELSSNNNIIFLGFKKNIIDYFNASDIYVSNSSSEGFSISVIEALECNLLLLLSNIPSHKECFEIDNSFYIGEYFDDMTFKTKKMEVVSHIENKKVKEFKEKYLSSKAMTNEYKKYY